MRFIDTASDGVILKDIAGGGLPDDEHPALDPLAALEVICGAAGLLHPGADAAGGGLSDQRMQKRKC